jgi:mono/diheme cytochrome c family protein
MVLSAIAFLALGGENAEAKSVVAYTGVQASRGAAVYTQRCAVCHGANLQGERLAAAWRPYDNQREIRHAATIGLRAATGPSA